jgi:hypothetical protein
VAEQHRLDGLRVERERFSVADVPFFAALKNPAIQQHCDIAEPDKMARASHFSRSATKLQQHLGFVPPHSKNFGLATKSRFRRKPQLPTFQLG